MREFGADIDIHEFVKLYGHKWPEWNKFPKAMRDAFRKPRDEAGFELAKLVAEGDRRQAEAVELELAAQQARLAKAEEVLAGPKPTKKAADDKRIATNKIKAAQRNLADLRRQTPEPKDSRIYPGSYAPVLIRHPTTDKRTVIPMRYQCRPAGKPVLYDLKYPGTYNARRDNLEVFWKGQFGHTHGIMIVRKFYENVERDGKNVVLEFSPEPPQDMLVACLWSHWTDPTGKGEPDLYSFAAITDEPPPEVAAAGHDRCIIPIKPEHVDAWLKPDSNNLEALYAILDDRPRPYYEHRIDKAA